VFAEFERSIIRNEFVPHALAALRSRPHSSKRIRAAQAKPGRPGVRKIAEQFGVNAGTVQRISRPFVVDGVSVAG
jgi:hypothetical protein